MRRKTSPKYPMHRFQLSLNFSKFLSVQTVMKNPFLVAMDRDRINHMLQLHQGSQVLQKALEHRHCNGIEGKAKDTEVLNAPQIQKLQDTFVPRHSIDLQISAADVQGPNILLNLTTKEREELFCSQECLPSNLKEELGL
ncbi:uncharacterized protein [Delphinus delphis]|uniref:uncharacterized protein isoform X2 n=1 Tax=Delphinus delphis TaxID=9728 RepID=UPI0028C40317|nr:uncharacterized protein LOC132417944 isoform X2 [Delphinus delphis]